jgi:hypothetical protein
VFLGGVFSVLVSATLVIVQLGLSGVAISESPLWIATALFTITALLEGIITVGAIRAIERLSPQSFRTHAPISLPARAAFATSALLLVTGGAWIASAAPDGLQHLAAGIGLEADPAWSYNPFADFAKPVAGLAGLACVYAVCTLGGKNR